MTTSFDVVVVGAGTAGAATALLCARRGLSVACLEASAPEAAGARYMSAIADWTFAAADLPDPRPHQTLPGPRENHMIAGWGPVRIVTHPPGILEVDLPAYTAHLVALGREAGVRFHYQRRVEGRRDGELRTSEGPIRGRWLVDASGMDGARLLGQVRPAAEDICQATHQLHRVADREGARAYFAEQGARWGHALAFLGVAGGYSVFNLRANGELLGVLAGTVPAEGHPPGGELVRRFVAEHPWVGQRLHGGGRAIPLRRPLDRLAHGPVAALGDAACQVYAPHGSGVGNGLLAARLLADALASGRGTCAYAAAFQRRLGGTLAAFDLMRRFNQALPPADLARLLRSGLLSPRSMGLALANRLPLPTVAELARMVRATLGEADLVLRLGRLLPRMAAVAALYRTYPTEPRRLPQWQAGLRALGLTPDPPPPGDEAKP